MNRTRILLLIITLIINQVALSALDFGMALHQNAAAYNAAGEENAFEYNAVFAPRVSFLAGDAGAFFISAAMSFGYKDGFYHVPELLRTEFSANWGALGFRLGRINYADPSAFIVNGLFDGFQLTHGSKAGRFGIGAWYSGLQYKRSANITMTQDEFARYNAPLDYGNFTGTYFAPPRFLASIDWEHLSLFGFMRLKTNITGQFDLQNADEKIDSQYFSLKPGIRAGSLLFEFGGTLQTAQTESLGVSDSCTAFAGEFGVFWTLPANFDSRLLLTAMFASGKMGNFAAFVPVSTKYHSDIFKVKMTSLTVAALGYTARMSRTFGTNITASYFIRNDLETPNFYPVKSEGNGGHFLGGEFSARIVWSPLSDLQANFGGGAFVPAIGNNWPDEKPLWRVNLSVVLAY